MIEITFTEQLMYPSQLCPIYHNYGESIDQQVQTYKLEEIILEKLRGILQHTKKLYERGWTRSRTRDYYDLYRLLRKDKNLFNDSQISIYLGLKCAAKNVGFETPDSFFDPRFISDVHKDWKQHLGYLTTDLPPIEVVLEELKSAIADLLKLEPTLGQLLGFSKFHTLLKSNDLLTYIKFRLKMGANPNDIQNNGHQPLNLALQRNLSEIALQLIEYGADYINKDASGINAFEWALRQELYDLAFIIHKKGFPYNPRHPNPHHNVPYQNLYKFDMKYFS